MTRYKCPHVHLQAGRHTHTRMRTHTCRTHTHAAYTCSTHTLTHTQTHILILSASLITLGSLFNEAGNSTHLPISTTLLLLNRLCLFACWLASHLFQHHFKHYEIKRKCVFGQRVGGRNHTSTHSSPPGVAPWHLHIPVGRDWQNIGFTNCFSSLF